MRCFLLIVLPALVCQATSAESATAITFEQGTGRVNILAGGEPFAVYVYEDAATLRPYFCNVLAPNGAQVTRNHPPDPEADADNTDHDTFHPGIWLAFGDVGGADFWRNKARVRHVRFEQAPSSGDTGAFAVVNVYETLGDPPRALCEETTRYEIFANDGGRWILMSSQFRALEEGVAFGDQEEMGLGVRIATPLTVKHGSGTILNSLGGVDENGTWGRQADWCAYSGIKDDNRMGIILMTSPDNFRASWYHNRDYGLMVANPFGRKSMTAPNDRTVPPDATPLSQEDPLTLGYAVCVFSGDTEAHPDYTALYERYRAMSAAE